MSRLRGSDPLSQYEICGETHNGADHRKVTSALGKQDRRTEVAIPRYEQHAAGKAPIAMPQALAVIGLVPIMVFRREAMLPKENIDTETRPRYPSGCPG